MVIRGFWQLAVRRWAGASGHVGLTVDGDVVVQQQKWLPGSTPQTTLEIRGRTLRVIALPHDRQSQTLLLGRYASTRRGNASHKGQPHEEVPAFPHGESGSLSYQLLG